jgi:hypothetical protein
MPIETFETLDRIGCLKETRAWLSARGLEVFEHPVCLDSVTRGVRVRHEAGGRAVDALNELHLLLPEVFVNEQSKPTPGSGQWDRESQIRIASLRRKIGLLTALGIKVLATRH